MKIGRAKKDGGTSGGGVSGPVLPAGEGKGNSRPGKGKNPRATEKWEKTWARSKGNRECGGNPFHFALNATATSGSAKEGGGGGGGFVVVVVCAGNVGEQINRKRKTRPKS